MSVRLTAKIEGAAELQRRLKELPGKIARRVVSKSLRAGAKVILQAAKAGAPKRTGVLRKSLKVKAGKRKKDRVSFTVQTAAGYFKGKTYYGAFLELGHRIGHRRLGNKRKQFAPMHFLSQAAESKAAEAVKVITETARQELANIVGR